MGYSDIRKRREAAKPAPKPKPQQKDKAEEVKRFEVGREYNGFICVDRWRDEKNGQLVAFIDEEEHDFNVEEAHSLETDFDGYDHNFDELSYVYHIRTHKGVEYAIDESDLVCVDGDLTQFDAEDIETPDEVAELSAKRPGRKVQLVVPFKAKNQPKPRRRKRKGNPLVGIVLIVIIAALVKSCAGI